MYVWLQSWAQGTVVAVGRSVRQPTSWFGQPSGHGRANVTSSRIAESPQLSTRRAHRV